MLNEFAVETKVSNEFFSPKTYLENGNEMSQVFSYDKFFLSKKLANFNQYMNNSD